jgi:hypothetical protein
MVGLAALILLSSCGIAHERYYSFGAQGAKQDDAPRWWYHAPILSIASASKDMHIQARIGEYSSCEVFNVIGGPLIAISCLWYKSLPDDSLTIYMLAHRPCYEVVKSPVDYDWTDEIEECARTQIRVKPDEMILLLGNGRRITPSSFETVSEEKDGIITYGQRALGFKTMYKWDLGGKDVEGLYLVLEYAFPPTTYTENIEFLPDGLYVYEKKQSFPPFSIRKSSGWKGTGPG